MRSSLKVESIVAIGEGQIQAAVAAYFFSFLDRRARGGAVPSVTLEYIEINISPWDHSTSTVMKLHKLRPLRSFSRLVI